MTLTKKQVKEEMATIRNSLKRRGIDMAVVRTGLGGKIIEAVEAGQMKIEHRGHYGNGRYDLARLFTDFYMPKCNVIEAKKIIQALKRKGKTRTFITIEKSSCLMECSVCGEDLGIETNGKIIRPTTDCRCPDGMVVEFELNVPSGKIVCRDDLRSWFDYYGDCNIDVPPGIMKAILEMEKIGCAHGYVGNSCPSIHRKENDSYIIANGAYTDEDYSDENYVKPEGKRVAGICTDLWWYSLVDYDEFKRRAGKVTPKEAGADVFAVKPGVYHFRHFYGVSLNHGEKKGEPYTYAEFQWVRKPDPVKDYLKEVKNRNFTLGQVVHRSMQNYPDLYPNTTKGIIGCVDHIFSVIGGGGTWHENGFVQFDPSMPANEPEVTIPKLDGPLCWYGLSPGYSAVCVAAGVENDYWNPDKLDHMNPSFLKVAFDVARNIYLFGTNNTHRQNDEQQEIALKCLQGLAKRYPKQVPEDCKILIMPDARK